MSFQVTFDALDPARLADFWCEALGYIIQPPPPEFESWDDWAIAMGIPEENWNDARALVDPEGSGPRIFIQKVPEEKSAKNRMHLDITVADRKPPEEGWPLLEARAAELEAIGATRGEKFEQMGSYWIVMADPEGNEFCIQ